MSKYSKRLELEDLKKGMSVKAQGHRMAFQAQVSYVIIDTQLRQGMATLDHTFRKIPTGEKTDVYWKEDQYAWSDKEDKIKLHLVDYSWLKGLAHNSLKINRAKETRKLNI